ncbi:MAG TPA: hypothetical protein VF692_04820 [Pyrinomonadaceae bacterium]|jgi:competence protein ComGC
MKKSIRQILAVLLLITALVSPIFTQTQSSNTVGNDQTISFLLTQNENARTVIAAQEIRIKDLESEVAVEKENSASVSKSYESAKSEIVSLKQSNEALSRAVSINEQTISLLQADNTKQKDKAKKANKAKWKAYGVVAVDIALRLIFR